jgi:UDP-glucose 4-epimerase
MKILVTGGLGFVGSNLVDKLVTEGHTVTVIDNLSSESSSEAYENKYARYYIDDIRNIDKYALPEIEVIFHLAGLARIQPSFDSPLEYVDVNVNGTAKVCELARNLNARLVYSSSSSINNGNYKTPYTFSKWAGEEVLKTWIQCYKLDAMICRFYNVYGPREPETGDYATVIRKFQRQYINGEPLTIVGDGNQRRDFTHVNDIVDGLIRVSEVPSAKPAELHHLGSGVNYSINELANMFTGHPKKYTSLRRGEGEVTLADYNKTFKRLGWKSKNNLEDYIYNFIQGENYGN